MFVDRVRIEIEGGKGGDGCCSFRREKYLPRGGPDGGNGGPGGSVIIQAESGINNLMAVSHRKHWRAGRGRHGQGDDRHGRGGDDLLILVPPGTVVLDADDGFVIKDLVRPGEQFVAARGGRGGKGNARFKSPTNRAPRTTSPGQAGECRRLILEMKVIADVGLIGRPNAGKSTLLSRLTHARPEIADYPFTTKQPQLGQVQLDIDRSFVMADIPGLIEGAHEGLGLGHEFLRHIQRAGVLIHLVEPQPMDGTDPWQNYLIIRDELARFDPQLAQRPEIVAITKAELPSAPEVFRHFHQQLASPPLLVSAVTGEGLQKLTGVISRQLQAEMDP